MHTDVELNEVAKVMGDEANSIEVELAEKIQGLKQPRNSSTVDGDGYRELFTNSKTSGVHSRYSVGGREPSTERRMSLRERPLFLRTVLRLLFRKDMQRTEADTFVTTDCG